MRFLHTADLHLGKRLNDLSLLEDQRHALGQICAIAESQRVDAVLIAGDIYQSAAPAAEAMALFNDFLTELSRLGKKVFIISGNHDDHRRISYLSELLRSRDIYVSEAFRGCFQRLSLFDEYGELVVYMLPFIKPLQAKRAMPAEEIESTQDALAALIRTDGPDREKRSLLLCHQFISGGESCQSEEISVGGLDSVDAALLADFDYVALGHLHGPQQLLRPSLRYSGSPLKYSFSELHHKKSVTIVDMREKGAVEVHTVPIEPLHELRELEEGLEELMALPYSEDYLRITVTDELVAPDARVSLATVFPNMMRFAVKNSKTAGLEQELPDSGMENKSVEELFCDFYRLRNGDRLPSEEQLKLLRELIDELEVRGD